MGYYTNYSLTIEKGDDAVIQEFTEECEGAEHAIFPDGESNNSTKWYSHQTDLMEFSKKHPDTVFCLYGEGEEAGDLWNLYVKNGKGQRCKAKIDYPLFDEKELKNNP